MRVPLSWLKDFVDIPSEMPIEALAEKLTLAGLEVGKIHYIGLPQNRHLDGITVPPSDHLVWDREKIVMGYIYEVKAHPDADRLVLAMVDHGTGEIEQIVTGAPNLFPYKEKGELEPPIPAPIAREGAEVYDGHAEQPGQRMILKERKIRGIPNRHMVCSEMELGISDEHEGVLLLDYEEFKGYAPGTSLQEVLGDIILDIDLTPNLARCFSILGVAREVAALLDLLLKEPDYSIPEGEGDDNISQYVSLDIREPELNPRFTLGLIKDVEIKPSPYWMQQRLKAIGQRPINNIVDVTNYVMFEIGQPTHAFDYDILADRAKAQKPIIITRLPNSGERLTTLDGTEHRLENHNLLVADAAGALSLAGVMGGLESEVQDPADYVLDATGIALSQEEEKPQYGKADARPRGTETVLLEAAAWNYINIRQTLSSTKLHSEAAARFSRGVHPAMAIHGLARGLRLMVEVSGGRLVSGVLDEYPNPPNEVVVDLPVWEVTRILGFEISQAEICRILRGLGFRVEEKGDSLIVIVPDHRLDIGEGVIGQADLIEEIARIYGYNRIPDTQISDSMPPQRGNPKLEREELTRDILVEAGLREVINYRLTTPEAEARLVPSGEKPAWGERPYVTLANPISLDKTVMRQTLLAGLLDNAHLNSHYQERQALFEIGSVYYTDPKGGLPQEPTHLGILMTGSQRLTDWEQKSAEAMDFYDLKGVIETLLRGLRIDPTRIKYEIGQHSSFHPGRVAQVIINGESIGVFGEIHPLIRGAFDLGIDLDRPVLAAEFDLDGLLAYTRAGHPVKPIPAHPAVYQDISIIVDRKLRATEIEQVIWKAGAPLLVDVRLFDVYLGDPIPADKKSLAYSLTYQHPDETLTDQKVAKVHEKIVKAVENQLGAKLRA